MTHNDPQTSVSPSPTPDSAEQTNARPATPVSEGRAKLELEAVRRIRKTYGRL